MTDYHFDLREADNYLATGGLGEVIGLTLDAAQRKMQKVQSDTDMMLALCMLADEGLKARNGKVEGSVQ